MKKLEKLKLHKLEEICAEDQQSMKGGDGNINWDPVYTWSGSGTYNGSGYVAPSDQNDGPTGSSDQTNFNIPSEHPQGYTTTGYVEPTIFYQYGSQGSCYNGSNR